MKIWRIGSNWGGIDLIPIFKEKKIAFAGLEVKDKFSDVKVGDLIAITNGQSIIAIGKATGLADLKNYGNNLIDEYEDVKAVVLNPLYWKDDFDNVQWGIYDGRGKQFHEATGPAYVQHISNLYNQIDSIAMNSKLSHLLTAAKNIVLTGAPGTGKTFLAKKIAEDLILTPGKLDDIVRSAFEAFRNFCYDPAEVDAVDASWQYWKQRILSDDFNLDEYANTLANATGPATQHGSYLTNFLERTSSVIYGSSKPGNAYNYGVKMNSNGSYGIGHSDDQLERTVANNAFEKEIKSWLRSFVEYDLDTQQEMFTIGNNLIRAGQLLRKIMVLEHPTELIPLYQDRTIEKAYRYLVGGEETNYFKQNRALLTSLLERFNLERTKVDVFRVYKFVWNYFSDKGTGNIHKDEADFKQRYLETYMEMVQFHPSYDYTDFFEGFRPYMPEGAREVGFKLRNGTFKDFCIKARKSLEQDRSTQSKEERKFIFIIDEINRAEINKVLGELFFAIDPGYRGEKGRIRTQYANMQTPESCFINAEDDHFYVPENVYIIGTMNDIDRSVESFDFALRRRFAWIPVKAEDQVGMWDGEIDAWKETALKKMMTLNKAIENMDGFSEAYDIGPSYFLKLKESGGDFNLLWDYHIGNVLQEYFRGMPDAAEQLESLKLEYNQA